jgi:hypothetical protein
MKSRIHEVAMRETYGGKPKTMNSPRQVVFASLIGTAIEFFDFYIYATTAVLGLPSLFLPASDPASATPASLATFATAFLARPIGSALFGSLRISKWTARL